jgi:hypothetical protein
MSLAATTTSPLCPSSPYQAAVERDYRWLGEAVVKHYHGDEPGPSSA